MKKQITKVLIVAALLIPLTGCSGISSTTTNKVARKSSTQVAKKKKHSNKKYKIAIYDDNGQKTEAFESVGITFSEDQRINFISNIYDNQYPKQPAARFILEDGNKKKSWVSNNGVPLIAYEGINNYADIYKQNKKDQKDLTKPEAYQFYQFLKKNKHYNKEEIVLFIKAKTGVIIGAFTGKKLTYDYGNYYIDKGLLQEVSGLERFMIFHIGGHKIIAQNSYFTAYPIKELEKMGDKK